MEKRLENNVNKQLWKATYPDWTPNEYKDRFYEIPYDIKGVLKSQDRRDNTVIIRLKDVMLVSMLEVDNLTAGAATVSMSLKGDQKKKDFTSVVEGKPLKHKASNTIQLGTLPCRYLKITFGKSNTGTSVQVNGIRLHGCPLASEPMGGIGDLLSSDIQY